MSFAYEDRSVQLTTSKREAEVIIVGAGAVGLLTALKLGRAGIDTIVLEAHNDILEAPRAIVYMPVVSKELRKLGIFERLRDEGVMNTDGVTWRLPDGQALATLPAMGETLTLGQDKMARTVLEILRKECPSVTAIFGQRCVGIEQQNGAVTVMTNAAEEDYIFSAKYVLGSDGANSAVRRMSLISFDGFTWKNFRFTAADIDYDFVKHCDLPYANFVVDSEDWAVIAKTGKQDIWRVCYGERANTSVNIDKVLERAPSRIDKWIRSINKSGNFDYKIRRLSPYWAHQRCASVYRKGNVLLAGDAAHSNNPCGGLGLTSGILDAVVVGNVLIRHLKGGEPDDIITTGLDARRKTWVEFVNPVSQANFRRLFSQEEADNHERAAFFEKLNQKDEKFLAMLGNDSMLLPDTFEYPRIAQNDIIQAVGED